jgi:hypothetical protein
MAQEETTFIQLNRCTLFSPLSMGELEIAVSYGNIQTFEAGTVHDLGSQSLGFLNVLLEGCVKVRRASGGPAQEILEQHEGSSFGMIDHLLELKHFKSVTAIARSRVFSVHRDSLRALLEELPRLKEHFSALRTQFARTAAVIPKGRPGYREDLAQQSGGLSFRVAPRFSVWEHRVHVQLPNGETRNVENVSFSGMWVIGTCDQEMDHEISFLFRATALDYPALELSGKVARKTEGGFAIDLEALSNPLREVWNNVVLKAMSFELVEPQSHKVRRLSAPLQASASTPEGQVHGELISLGTEGAVFQAAQAIPRKAFRLQLRLPRQEGPGGNLEIDAAVLGGRSNNYLLGFQRLDPPIRDFILSHLSRDALRPATAEVPEETVPRSGVDVRNAIAEVLAQATTVEVLPARSVPEEGKEAAVGTARALEAPESLRLRDLNALRDLYYTDLRNRVIHLPARPHVRLHTSVQVAFQIPLGLRRLTGMDALPVLQGTVIRLDERMGMLRLGDEEAEKIQAVKAILDRCGVAEFDREFSTLRDVEYNTEHRRYFQLTLLVLLFFLCLVWSWDALGG